MIKVVGDSFCVNQIINLINCVISLHNTWGEFEQQSIDNPLEYANLQQSAIKSDEIICSIGESCGVILKSKFCIFLDLC